MDIFQTSLFLWGTVLIVTIPFIVILLTEVLERLERVKHPLTAPVALLRNAVLPLLTLLIVLRTIIEFNEVDLSVRLIATLFWLILIRTHLIQNIWQLPLGELASALGFGSVAIAFALQDTFSNLVSGLLLLINRPFVVGEWIHIGDVEGRVQDVNWRYTILETRDGDLLIMPNGAVAQQSFANHSRPTKFSRIIQPIDIAFVNPPNKAKQMLVETMLQTPGIVAHPPPVAAVTRIDDPLMGYEVRYWIDNFADREDIHDRFMTRVWYAAQRHDVPFPSPAYDLFHYDGPKTNQEGEITDEMLAAKLRDVYLFSTLPDQAIDSLAYDTQLLHYAQKENIITIGRHEPGVFVLRNGKASMTVPDQTGTTRTIQALQRDDFFGETGLFGRAISPYTITAETDLELLLIEHSAMTKIINQHPQVASELNTIINKRRLTLERLTHASKSATE